MKVCLVDINKNGNHLIYKDFNGGLGTRFEVGNSFLAKLVENAKIKSINLPILALGYASAIFLKYRHNISYINEISDVLKDADLIIFYASLANCDNEKRALKTIKGITGGKVCLIGPFASAVPAYFEGLYDFIIKGEPESFFERIAKDSNLNYEGVVFSEPYDNLDEIIFPNWSIFPHQSYSYLPNIIGRPVLPFLASRGCLYNCDYCAYRANYSFRQRSVANIIEEIKYLKDNYKIRGILFRDPIFTIYRNKTMELLRGIIDQNLITPFACETRLDHLDFELVDAMGRAGCASINVGIESYDEDILKHNARKPVEKKHQEEIAVYCKKKGVSLSAFYILGLPGDTEKNILDTINYAKKLNTLSASFNVFTPCPGTEAFSKHQDIIAEKDFGKYSFYYPVIRYDRLTPERILELKEYAVVSYYFRLKFLFFSFLLSMIKKYLKHAFIYRRF